MSRYRPIPTLVDFPALEVSTLERWRTEDTFRRSIDNRAGAPLYVFDDGPPFATGLPHYGHILTSYIKDVVPRYFTMRGYRVPRRWGWDCHGLPVEYEVEKERGQPARESIAAMGVADFTDACRSLVLRYAGEWEQIIRRLGRWVDFDGAYRTMDRSYMESVMWAFARLYERGLIYEGRKVVPYCLRCQTPLSHFESRLDDAYRPRTDLSCAVRFRLVDDPGASLLAWTTTPWTLPANVALAVHPDLEYVEYVHDDDRVWVASGAAARWSSLAPYEPGQRRSGRDLVGLRYAPLFPHVVTHANAFVVLAADFVSETEGTGIVHLAPAFGEDDDEACRTAGIEGPLLVRDDGTFTGEVPELEGLHVFDASSVVVRTLHERGLVFASGDYEHDYPHCWRCDRPLIYRAVRSWFVRVTAIKDDLVRPNRDIAWTPVHVRDGRFGQWLENVRDWAISRDRFWGAPIPAWRCHDCGHVHVVGSLAELEDRAGEPVDDLHRPHVDAIRFPCDRCGGPASRVPDVLDCWFESGSMPFAQLHHPFEHQAERDAARPADFIVEYVAQTRGWFYTLHVLAVALFGRPAFRSAVCHGVVLGADGRKMSKRLQNYPDPMQVVAAHGSDALRIALLSSPVVRGVDVSFDEAAVRDGARRFLIPLWNTVHYFTTYASADGFEPSNRPASRSALDRYLLHETEHLRSSVETAMAANDFGAAYDAIEAFIDTLSGWYLRLSRTLAWSAEASDAKTACYETLHEVLDVVTRVLAPFMPFTAEALYEAIGGAGSVHLTDWPAPRPGWRDDALAGEMAAVRDVVRLARSIRERHRVRHRHPMPALYVAGVDRAALERHADLLRHEVNVKRVDVLDDPDRHVTRTLVLRAGDLGRRLTRRWPDLRRAVAAGEHRLRDDGSLVWNDIVVGPGEYTYRMALVDDTAAVAAEGRYVVSLDLERDARLVVEATARDLNRAVQDLRKRAGLRYTDRIVLAVVGEADDVLAAFGAWLQEQTLAVALDRTGLDAPLATDAVIVDGRSVRLEIGEAGA